MIDLGAAAIFIHYTFAKINAILLTLGHSPLAVSALDGHPLLHYTY